MFRASQREIVGTMAALCLTPRHPPAVRQGATRKLSAAGHAASHEHWLRTIATADWSKTCRRRTNMHKKLARLVTWLAGMLDRNRSWFPKSTNLKPPRRPLGRTCKHCAFRSPSALTQVTLRMLIAEPDRLMLARYGPPSRDSRSWRRSCAMRCIKRCVTQVTSAASRADAPYLNSG
jgi:hypothetical protein